MLLFSKYKKDSRGLSLIEASMVLALSKPAADRYLTVDKAASECSTKIDSGGGDVRVYMLFKG